eukprot:CAMPEP_0114571066 /NCGR_PEP_ID=MMETSP0114-20121206/17551_1 /TAXON_ID=31324 /ORGANISM="Goniomonas sp, Strain m" /LENGTH=187 /DNA_ID=CAMNT_0001758167 /DNA_START=9 /DNA_END=572 /DNA_ORIENTATION=+
MQSQRLNSELRIDDGRGLNSGDSFEYVHCLSKPVWNGCSNIDLGTRLRSPVRLMRKTNAAWRAPTKPEKRKSPDERWLAEEDEDDDESLATQRGDDEVDRDLDVYDIAETSESQCIRRVPEIDWLSMDQYWSEPATPIPTTSPRCSPDHHYAEFERRKRQRIELQWGRALTDLRHDNLADSLSELTA